MRSQMRAGRAAVLGGAAMLGLAGAHILDYFLLYRNSHVRTGLLLRTGHAYFGHAVEFAAAAAILAAIGSFAFGVLREHGHHVERPSIWRTAAILSLIQSGGFIALEAGERVAAHAPAGQLTKVTLLGVALQAAVATITAFILSLIERAGSFVSRALVGDPPLRRVVLIRVRPRKAILPRLSLLSRAPPRAPPLAFTS
jgi:hypothetical protein